MKNSKNTIVKLKIADVVIQMQSRFPLKRLSKEEKAMETGERFNSFFYKGKAKPEILIDVNIVSKLPNISAAQTIFITKHFQDQSENWRLLKKGNSYIYKTPLKDKKQLMVVNKNFNRITAYLLPKNKTRKKEKEFIWSSTDLIYDFLQVLLINYLAITKKDGIFTHSMGVKDISGDGFLFAGKSGAGKSTLAKIYHKTAKTKVLNDDRIIIRKLKNKFYIYGSPWHGDFSDYLASRVDSAKLKGIFFLRKAKINSAKPVNIGKAFKLLYPAMFPTFWDKEGTTQISSFLLDLLSSVGCFRLDFRKDKSVVDFVRKIAV